VLKPPILTSILLAGSLSGCQTRKNMIFLEQAWNRDYAKNACQIYKRNYNVACVKTPEQMATELKRRFASAVLQSPACKHVRISYEPVGEVDMKDYLSGWSLTFDVGIDIRDIDYSNSAWQMLDNKTNKRFEGPLKDAAEAATRICIATTRRCGSVSP
jgi:hypothetical protein